MMAAEENHKVVDLDEEEEKHEAPSTGCGILARYPVISILSFASVGIAIGLGISDWDPEDPEDKAIAIQWIGLIGEMFIRALKAVVLPLVFVNVVLSVIDMMFVGSAGSVGLKTIGLYLLTTLIAAIIGLFRLFPSKVSLIKENSMSTLKPDSSLDAEKAVATWQAMTTEPFSASQAISRKASRASFTSMTSMPPLLPSPLPALKMTLA